MGLLGATMPEQTTKQSATTNGTRPSVVIVRSSFSPREARVLKLARSFADAGFDTTIYCWDRDAKGPKREERDGFTIVRCRLRAPYGSRWLFVMTPLWLLCEMVWLLRAKVDAIHACDFDTILPALAAKWLSGKRVVYDIFDFYAAKSRTIPKPMLGLFRMAEQWCARRADAVSIVDEARAYQLGEPAPVRLIVTENCPPDAVQPDWEKPPLDGPLRIFYGGAITGYRGLRKLARITDGLEGVEVIVAGRVTNPAYEAVLRDAKAFRYIGEMDYAAALRQTYECDAIYAYYDPALEVNRTANSSKMYDAFMCGTAVMVNSEPPAAAVVAENGCGSCLPYADDEALKAQIIAWRDDRAACRESGSKGRILFEERYSWDRVFERVRVLYRELGLNPS